MYATNYFEAIVLNLARGISATAPAKMYLALFMSDPGDTGGGTEVSYSGYARKEITFSAPAASGNGYAIQNSAAITFATANTTVGNATHVGVMDSASGGNMYLYGALGDALAITADIAPVVRAGAVKWISTGALSNAYKAKIFNILRGTDCAGFTPYVALCNGNPEDSGAEFSGNGYARQAITFSAPSAQSGGASMITNSAQVEMPIATGTWGNLTHVALYDAESNGNPYLIDQASTQGLITQGKGIIYPASSFNFSFN